MKHKRAQIDQGISSIIVFFGVFILMAIFVTVSGNIANVLNVSPDREFVESKSFALHTLDSRISTELFLLEEVDIDGKQTLVVDFLEQGFDLNEAQRTRGLEVIQNAFHEEYGCDGKNRLVFYKRDFEDFGHEGGSADIYSVYLNYPKTIDALETETFTETTFGGETPLLPKDSHFHVINRKDNDALVLVLKEDVRC